MREVVFILIAVTDERTAPDIESEIQLALREHPPTQSISNLSELAPALDEVEQEWVQISGPSIRHIGSGLERTQHVLAQPGLSDIADVLFHHSSMVLATGLEEGRGRTLHQWSPNHWIQAPEPRHLLIPGRVRPACVIFRREWLVRRLPDLAGQTADLSQLVHRGVVAGGNAARLLVLPWTLAEEVINVSPAAADLLEALDFDLVPQLLTGLTWKNAWGDPDQAVMLELMVENVRPTRQPIPQDFAGRLRSLSRRLLRFVR